MGNILKNNIETERVSATGTGIYSELLFVYQTILNGNYEYLKGYAELRKSNYFESGKEFRFVMEWANSNTNLTHNAARTARVGFFVPILG